MSTGKRLAKRSIVGTRICAPGDDGLFYSGVIQMVKSTPEYSDNYDSKRELNKDSKYLVRFDGSKKCPPSRREFTGRELIGPGFQSLAAFTLKAGQKVYLTYNGRETSAEVVSHDTVNDEVTVQITPPGIESALELKKKLEEVRLLESRKSARLMDQDQDFARLADMAADRKNKNGASDYPPLQTTSRKRRTSSSHDDIPKEDHMNECTAALVLMSLSCSPGSSLNGSHWPDQPLSPSASSSDGASWRSGTPSPPLSESGGSGIWGTDEGIGLEDDYDENPKKKKSRMLFRCTWPGCGTITTTCKSIEAHVRLVHLRSRNDRDNGYGEEMDSDDREEEFYYTEVELGHTYSPPTLSHRDMARPPHEDPEYLKTLLPPGSIPSPFSFPHAFAGKKIPHMSGPINIPVVKNMQWSLSNLSNLSSSSMVWASRTSPIKHLKLSFSAPNGGKLSSSPTRKSRGETKKCRKVYGMDHRELWCTQCKWKKACTRFD